jgi:hypothetical protein
MTGGDTWCDQHPNIGRNGRWLCGARRKGSSFQLNVSCRRNCRPNCTAEIKNTTLTMMWSVPVSSVPQAAALSGLQKSQRGAFVGTVGRAGRNPRTFNSRRTGMARAEQVLQEKPLQRIGPAARIRLARPQQCQREECHVNAEPPGEADQEPCNHRQPPNAKRGAHQIE